MGDHSSIVWYNHPSMLMNAGFPLTGIGLGSIVSALELPVSVMAYVLLNEDVNATQWLGIVLIILAIVLMNINWKKVKLIQFIRY
jgi:drug/metabolite transporter (DMT)-like permease